MDTKLDATPDGLAAYAHHVADTWVEWSDEDISELAQAAVDALRALASKVGVKNPEAPTPPMERLASCHILTDEQPIWGRAVRNAYKLLSDEGFDMDETWAMPELYGTYVGATEWRVYAHKRDRSRAAYVPIRLI